MIKENMDEQVVVRPVVGNDMLAELGGSIAAAFSTEHEKALVEDAAVSVY
jgi:hypothetical protein